MLLSKLLQYGNRIKKGWYYTFTRIISLEKLQNFNIVAKDKNNTKSNVVTMMTLACVGWNIGNRLNNTMIGDGARWN